MWYLAINEGCYLDSVVGLNSCIVIAYQAAIKLYTILPGVSAASNAQTVMAIIDSIDVFELSITEGLTA